MADMDTLIVTFQTQLSDVMETVVKTAMYEVTRLVEDSLLEQLKARSQEVETLRIQLQWAERKLSDQGAKEAERTGKCVDSMRDEVETSKGANPDINRRGHTASDTDTVESRMHVAKSRPTHGQDESAASFSPVWKSQANPHDHVKLVEDIKEEAALPPSCSSLNLEEWRVTLGDAGTECQNSSVMTEAQENLADKNNQELLRHIIQIELDPQLSASFVASNGQQDTINATSTNHVRSLETNSSLLQMDISSEKDCQAQSSQKSAKESVKANAKGIPGSPRQNVFGVSIKQEVIDDPEQVEEKMLSDNKTLSYSELTAFPKLHVVRTGTPKQSRFSHKPSVHIGKFKVSTVFRPNVGLQHLQRALKRPQASLSNSSTTTLNAPHSQAVNTAHRNASTSKAPPSLPLSVQRAQVVDKHALNRSGAPWINAKSQLSSNSFHTNPSLHIDSHLHTGPRQILRCGQCGKCFPHPSNLKSHLQTHTGERPFCCSLCGRSFTKLSNLKAHRRVHTGERPYTCQSCGKRFTQKCNLKRHQRIHING